MRVIRSNAVVSPAISMRLARGDSITTSATTRVVIYFAAGYRVTLDTLTAIFIEPDEKSVPLHHAGSSDGAAFLRRATFSPGINGDPGRVRVPSRLEAGGEGTAGPGSFTAFFIRIGRAFIERIKSTPDTLTPETPGAKLHDAGTKYLVSVSPAGRTTISVTEGAVSVESPDRKWPTITYTTLEEGEYGVGSPPRRMGRLRPQDLAIRLGWVRDVERITRIPVPRLDSLTLDEARATVERAGMRILIVRHEKTGRAAPERVVDQSPSAGDSVTPGTYVSLVLESTPRLTRQDSASGREDMSTCTVPNIVQLSKDEAEKRLKSRGLRGLGTRTATGLDRVTSQSERADTPVRCGTVVRYNYGVIG